MFLQVQPTLKPALTEMIVSYYQHQPLNQTLCRDVMTSVMASVVGEMTHTIRKVPVLSSLGRFCVDKKILDDTPFSNTLPNIKEQQRSSVECPGYDQGFSAKTNYFQKSFQKPSLQVSNKSLQTDQ